MPIYEFLCRCGHRFEKLCKTNDKPFLTCPVCGGESRRVFSAFRVGRSSGNADGFYTTGSACSSCSSSDCAGCSSR